MKLTIVSTMGASPWGGSEELWAATVEEALNEGDEVCISMYEWPTFPEKLKKLQQKGAIILRRPHYNRPGKFNRFVRFKRILDKVTRHQSPSPFEEVLDFKADVVCISQGGSFDAIWLIPDFLRELYSKKIPYIAVCQANHETFFQNESDREAALEFFNQASHVVFVSSQNLKAAERQLAQTIAKSIVVQNPVNLREISPVPWSSNSPACLANVARLSVLNKGQDILFEALSTKEWKSRAWKLRLYGEGENKDYLKALCIHYEIGEKVEFCGYVEDLRKLWAENHILVLPSRFEGTPLVLVEALLCARPAVVTNVGGNIDWVEEATTGFIAEAATAKLVGEALERAWQARSQWQSLGKRAHELALSQLDKAPGKTLLKIIHSAKKTLEDIHEQQ